MIGGHPVSTYMSMFLVHVFGQQTTMTQRHAKLRDDENQKPQQCEESQMLVQRMVHVCSRWLLIVAHHQWHNNHHNSHNPYSTRSLTICSRAMIIKRWCSNNLECGEMEMDPPSTCFAMFNLFVVVISHRRVGDGIYGLRSSRRCWANTTLMMRMWCRYMC